MKDHQPTLLLKNCEASVLDRMSDAVVDLRRRLFRDMFMVLFAVCKHVSDDESSHLRWSSSAGVSQ